jgi:hypothetical protein
MYGEIGTNQNTSSRNLVATMAENRERWTMDQQKPCIQYLERQFEDCVLLNITCSLSYPYPLDVSSLEDIEETPFIPRQTELWERITALEDAVKLLLLDIWVTVDPVPSFIPKFPILLF